MSTHEPGVWIGSGRAGELRIKAQLLHQSDL